jgi:hypothetical protein
MIEATQTYWLARVTALELRISELEMALDLANSQAMAKH